jgi:hypothetical protein
MAMHAGGGGVVRLSSDDDGVPYGGSPDYKISWEGAP